MATIDLSTKTWAEMTPEERQSFILNVAMADPSYVAAKADKAAVEAAEKQAVEASRKLAEAARTKLAGELDARIRAIFEDGTRARMLAVGLTGFTVEVTPGGNGGAPGLNVKPLVKAVAQAKTAGEAGKVAPKAQEFLALTGQEPGKYFLDNAPADAVDYYKSLASAGLGAEQDSYKRAILIPLAVANGDLKADHGLAYNKTMASEWAAKGVKGNFSKDVTFEVLARRATARRAEKATKG